MDSWISLEIAKQSSYGRVEWWKCRGPNGEQVPVKQQHPLGPEDRPVWCHEEGWMYLGSWENNECHGFGVYYFLNGRVYVGHLDHNRCTGLACLFWLPASPIWEKNELPLSIIKTPDEQKNGLPYIYIGNFVESEKADTKAKVILKDGTTRIGPFMHDKPVGDWWHDHEKSFTTPQELGRLLRFSDDIDDDDEEEIGQSAETDDSPLNEGRWLTLEEARDLVYGQVEWWKCPGPHGETLDERQYHPKGPPDRPVFQDDNECMYLGGWRDDAFHGFGVFYFPNGRVFAGYLIDNTCSGPAKLVWVPDAPIWKNNEMPESSIRTKVAANEETAPVGLPYIYIGCFEAGERSDNRAKVILKDGTTRWGPFDADEPIGDWWETHEKGVTSQDELTDLLSFGSTPRVSITNDENDDDNDPSLQDKTSRVLLVPATGSARGSDVVDANSHAPTNEERVLSTVDDNKVASVPIVATHDHNEPSNANSDASTNGARVKDDACKWLTVDEARNRSYVNVSWWRIKGPNGEQVKVHQHYPGGPMDRPIWSDRSGWMYLGSWKGDYYHGYGVMYFNNGRVFAGYFDENKCCGPAKLIWLPLAPTWIKDEQARSVIEHPTRRTADGQKVGLPYIYIGSFKDNIRNDNRARVILKDGTTRIGPFQGDRPVGDWWADHEKSVTTQAQFMDMFSSFESTDSSTSSEPLNASMAIAPNTESTRQNGSWLSLEESRQRACGKVAWWKCEGPNGENVEEIQQNPDGPPSRPVWLDASGWMYLGGWDGREYSGFGVMHFPNGRVFAGHFSKNKCWGQAKLIWLPSSTTWIKNTQARSVINCTIREGGVEKVNPVPYIYIGGFKDSQRCDSRAKVILKDGTTRVGPFDADKPVGDWWEDHEKLVTSAEEIDALISCTPKEEKVFIPTTPPSPTKMTWISLEDAKSFSYGNVEWWKCEGPGGESVDERQHQPDGPSDRPVWVDGNGWMYLGGWKKNEYHGFGVLYFPNGRIFSGNFEHNRCSGYAKLIWLPLSPTWMRNEQDRSVIQYRSNDGGKERLVPVPYIYIGYFKNSQRCDERAKVILKDGTTRIGPFNADQPIGDWWDEHEKAQTSPEELKKLLAL